MEIYKGDAIKIPFTIKFGELDIDTTNCVDVEIAVGNYIKSYKKGEVTFVDGKWLYPLSQKETFAMRPPRASIQVRILFPDGTVKGVNLEDAEVVKNISNEVLTDG